MAIDYSFLTDRAMCDAATAEIDFKLLVYTTHDAVDNLATQRSERSSSSTASKLAAVNAKITAADILLSTAGIEPSIIKENTNKRAALLVQRTTLTERGHSTEGLKRFMDDVEDEQADTQVVALNTIKAGIAAHRDALAA